MQNARAVVMLLASSSWNWRDYLVDVEIRDPSQWANMEKSGFDLLPNNFEVGDSFPSKVVFVVPSTARGNCQEKDYGKQRVPVRVRVHQKKGVPEVKNVPLLLSSDPFKSSYMCMIF